ncbi:MAG: ABC transporter permease, partial [Vicinamibacterales bacterium]
MTRSAARLVLVLTLVAVTAPLLAPYDQGLAFRDYLHAPPMRPGLSGAHPLVLVDRLEQRYEPDASRVVPLPWFATKDDAPVFLLGSDNFGRDVMSRLLYGARTSIGLALVATLGAVVIGALAGTLAGYRGGWIDEAVMRVADFILVLPAIYVVLVLRAVLPLVLPPATVFLLISIIFVAVGWPFVARGVRAIVAVERDREYVLAARSLGASHARVMVKHLIPACGGYLIVQATLLLPAFILGEATLSFVGLGFQDTVASWGTMLVESSNIMQAVRFPWTLAPAVAIFAVVLSTNLMTS